MLTHVSHSQISMWIRCPRQWEYRYQKGVKLVPSGPLVEGGCYHDTLEFNFKQKIETKTDYSVDDWMDIFSTFWDKRLAEEEVGWEDNKPDDLKEEGIRLVREYALNVAPTIQPVKVEETYYSDVAGVTFICRIDLETDTGLIIDHKTSARKYSQIDVDYDIQASAEAFVLNRPIMFENHVAVKTARPLIQIVGSARTIEDINWWFGMASRVVLQMKTGVAPPKSIDAFGKAGWWCSRKFCDNFDDCRGGLTRS